ncbi:hypothetical protein [Kitasatospora sp. P5_F3]
MPIMIIKSLGRNPFKKSSKDDHEDAFLAFLGRTFWLGTALIIGAALLDLPETKGWQHQLVRALEGILGGLGAALLIAFVVAALVEPYMRWWYATQMGEELWWAVQRKNAPSAMRKAITDLAQSKEYYRSVTWKIRFSWVPDSNQSQLKVELEAHSRGFNLDEPDFHPEVGLWLMKSAPPHESFHTGWKLDVPDLENSQWEMNTEQIRRVKAGEEELSRYYPESATVPIGKTYLVNKSATIYPNSDFIPLRIRAVTERFHYEISGDAARHFEFKIKHPNEGGQENAYRFDHADQQIISIDSAPDTCNFPGQVTLISWAPIPPAGTGGTPDASHPDSAIQAAADNPSNRPK